MEPVEQLYSAAEAGESALDRFLAEVQRKALLDPEIRVLEAGTMRWRPERRTHHRHWLQEVKNYVMTDLTPGTDVDFAADLHHLSEVTGEAAYDAFLACSVWEHLKKPWVAAREVAKVLKPGGVLFIQTHAAFPLHGYPYDYFRFSREALQSLFEDALEVIRTDYDFPAQIHAAGDPGAKNYPAFLNVNVYAKKATT